MTLLTVVICTYNRAFILGECLDSLIAQTIPLDQFEILVVDNNSTDNTQKIATEFCERTPNARMVFEPLQGLSHARNRGLAEAQSEWVAFLDDDAKASPQWVASILKTIASDDFDCFGGPYRAWHRFGPPPEWFSNDWESSIFIHQRHYGPMVRGNFPTGGTCTMRKNLALSLGGFPTNVGMSGDKCAYGEETALFQRMLQTNLRIGYVPEMVIDHCVLPYKYNLMWRLKSAYAHGRDDPGSWKHIPPTGRKRGLYFSLELFKEVIWRIPKRLVSSIRQKHRWQRTILECFTPLMTLLGKGKSALCQSQKR